MVSKKSNLTIKRIKIRNHYYIAVWKKKRSGIYKLIKQKKGITKKSVISKVSRSRKPQKPKISRKLLSFRDQAERDKKDLTKKTIKLTDKAIIRKIRLTNVNELHTDKPLSHRKGVLEIRFAFYKKLHSGKIGVVQATGRSDKRFYPKSAFNIGYDECLTRALGQINFSPDGVKVIRIGFVYWVSKKVI